MFPIIIILMQSWNLAAGDPLSLSLSADARLTETDYADDQTWELRLGGGEPPALALQTTFGLRAHWMRLFPRFVRGDTARSDPAAFHTPPRLVCFYPNFLAITFSPFDGLDVLAEYWAPDSHTVTGRLQLTNHSILPQNFRLEWVGMLNPIERQGGMITRMVGPNCVLEGETAYLHPVVCLTGGPQPGTGPYPSLSLEIELYPSISRQFSWACASLRSYDASLEAARAATARPWDAEHARMEMLNFSQGLQIETGSPDWDAALALTQKTAHTLLMKNTVYLPEASFVLSRGTDQGFSPRGDGNDHAHLWSGQTAFDAYYLTSLLLPGAPELAAGLLRNFLAVQDETGAIDWKPGLGGQHSRRLAQPLLATLAVRIGQYLPKAEWFGTVFPALLRFFNIWFDPQHDQDGDGFPEWQHAVQSAVEDSPIFDRWSPGSQGMDSTRLESPALGAMLYRECLSLIEMAETLVEAEKAEAAYARLSGTAAVKFSGAAEVLPELRERAASLREAVESTWDDEARRYAYRDFETHLSLPGKSLITFNGPRRFAFKRRFKQPHRLVIHLEVSEERTYAAMVTLIGFNEQGEVREVLPPRSFSWLGTQARATTQNTFLAIQRVEVEGLTKEDTVHLFSADYTLEDCSLLLPLWAGAADKDRARTLITETFLQRFLLPHGMALCPQEPLEPISEDSDTLTDGAPEPPNRLDNQINFSMPWNQMIGEGLLRYGYRAEAAALVTRLMNAIANTLKQQQTFRQTYNAITGQAGGERGHLHGLAPLGLFLQTLGIYKLDPKEILIHGFNPYPSTIIVKYRKVILTCHPDRTEIAFPGGQSIIIDQPGPHRVSRS